MRPPSLKAVQRTLGFIILSWMAFMTTLMLFIPSHLATLPQTSLAPSLASRVAVNYVQPVYNSIGSFGNILASGYGWIASSAARERAAIEATLESTVFSDTDNTASTVDTTTIGMERELGLLHDFAETRSSRIPDEITYATTPIDPDIASSNVETTAIGTERDLGFLHDFAEASSSRVHEKADSTAYLGTGITSSHGENAPIGTERESGLQHDFAETSIPRIPDKRTSAATSGDIDVASPDVETTFIGTERELGLLHDFAEASSSRISTSPPNDPGIDASNVESTSIVTKCALDLLDYLPEAISSRIRSKAVSTTAPIDADNTASVVEPGLPHVVAETSGSRIRNKADSTVYVLTGMTSPRREDTPIGTEGELDLLRDSAEASSSRIRRKTVSGPMPDPDGASSNVDTASMGTERELGLLHDSAEASSPRDRNEVASATASIDTDTEIASPDVEIPSIRAGRELGLSHVFAETTCSRIRSKASFVTTPVVLAVAYLPDLSSLPPTTTATIRKYRYLLDPIFYGILVHDVATALFEFVPVAHAQGLDGDESCLCDPGDVFASHPTDNWVWKHASRTFRRYFAYGSGNVHYTDITLASSLPASLAPCRCESATTAPIVQEQDASSKSHHPPPDPQIASSQRRAVEASGSTDDTKKSVSEPRPILRVHDCGMDDPNWRQGVFFSAKSQSRSCLPTYEPWKTQPGAPSQMTGDCSEFKSSRPDSKCLSKGPQSQRDSNNEPLVYGLPSNDPRNRYVDRDPVFRPCLKGALQSLTIFGGKTRRECRIDHELRFEPHFNLEDEESIYSQSSVTEETIDEQLLPTKTSAVTREESHNRSVRSSPSPLANLKGEHAGNFSDNVGRCFEMALCLAFIVVFLFAFMGLQVVLYPFYGPWMWILFLVIRLCAVHIWSTGRPIFRWIQTKRVKVLPAELSRADGRMFAVRTSVRTPRISRGFLRRVSANTRNGRQWSPSPNAREILGRPAIRGLGGGGMRIISPRSAERASVFDLFALRPTPSVSNSPAVTSTSITHGLRGSRSEASSSGERLVNSAIDNPERSTTPLEHVSDANALPGSQHDSRSRFRHDSQRGSQRGSQSGSLVQRLSSRSVRRPQALAVKTNVGNLPVSKSADTVMKVDKGKGAVRAVNQTTLSSMMIAPVDLRVFSHIGTRAMRIGRSSSLGDLAASKGGLRTTEPSFNVKATSSRMGVARPPLAQRLINGSASSEAQEHGLLDSSSSKALQPPHSAQGSLNASSSRTVRPTDDQSGRTVRASPALSHDGLSNRTVRPQPPTPECGPATPPDEVVVAVQMPRRSGASRRPLAVVPIEIPATPEIRSPSPPTPPLIAPVNGLRSFVPYYDPEEEVTEQERQSERPRGRLGPVTRGRPPPPPPAVTSLPRPLEIVPSIPGVRTFVPYYDTEEDVLEQERQAERRERREERRAEREAEEALLSRCKWTGRVIKPAPADPLPSGARLSPLRVESAYGPGNIANWELYNEMVNLRRR